MPTLISNSPQKSKNHVRLCAHQNKDISVFEQQLSLIDSSTLTESYPHLKLTNYNSHLYSRFSTSANSSNSSGSTLIASPVHSKYGVITSPGVLKPLSSSKSHVAPNHASVSRTGSIHLRIPLYFLISSYTFMTDSVVTLSEHFTQAYKENSEFVLSLLAMIFISGFTLFGTEILEFRHDLFLAGILLVALSGYKISLNKETAILLKGSTVELLEDKNDLDLETKSIISHIVVGFQSFLLCSLFRTTSLFKNHYMDITSKIDHLSLILLASYVIFVSLNMLQCSIPCAIHFSTDRKMSHESSIFLPSGLSG